MKAMKQAVGGGVILAAAVSGGLGAAVKHLESPQRTARSAISSILSHHPEYSSTESRTYVFARPAGGNVQELTVTCDDAGVPISFSLAAASKTGASVPLIPDDDLTHEKGFYTISDSDLGTVQLDQPESKYSHRVVQNISGFDPHIPDVTTTTK